MGTLASELTPHVARGSAPRIYADANIPNGVVHYMRAHLGWETTRQRCAASVLRCAPCLIGLFSIVTLIFIRLWRSSSSGNGGRGACWTHHTPCYHKAEPTFADALYAVRRTLWDGCLLKHVLGPRRVTTLPRHLKRTLITYLAEAG